MEIARRYGVSAAPRRRRRTRGRSTTPRAACQHEVWFGDATTSQRRIKVAQVRGLGLGFWRLGREDQRIWDDPQIAPGTTWP